LKNQIDLNQAIQQAQESFEKPPMEDITQVMTGLEEVLKDLEAGIHWDDLNHVMDAKEKIERIIRKVNTGVSALTDQEILQHMIDDHPEDKYNKIVHKWKGSAIEEHHHYLHHPPNHYHKGIDTK
jgi:hypothetical protein